MKYNALTFWDILNEIGNFFGFEEKAEFFGFLILIVAILFVLFLIIFFITLVSKRRVYKKIVAKEKKNIKAKKKIAKNERKYYGESASNSAPKPKKASKVKEPKVKKPKKQKREKIEDLEPEVDDSAMFLDKLKKEMSMMHKKK